MLKCAEECHFNFSCVGIVTLLAFKIDAHLSLSLPDSLLHQVAQSSVPDWLQTQAG